MRAFTAVAIAVAIAAPGAAPAAAEGITPRRPDAANGRGSSDSMWSPPSYGLATAPAPGELPAATVTPWVQPSPSVAPPPAPTPAPEPVAMGNWIGELTCEGIPVCGFASASRGWGFALYVQRWSCSTGSCNPLPATVSANNAVCQTSTGNLGYVYGQQCYMGQQPF